MADSDKNILITPNSGSTTADPNIVFTGGDNNPVTMTVVDDGTLSFSGSAGQLFSISDSLSGTIFSVNDISGIPSIEVDDTGEVRIAEFSGNVLIGTSTDNGNKLQVNGGGISVGGTTIIDSSGNWVGSSSGFTSNTPGNVSAFAMSSAPSGWLKCNGAAISRTTYSALFASIGTTFGGGNGSTTFNLPDLRGEFIRGWDDGRGADSGRGFGSYQGDAIRNITGMVKTANERNDHLNNGAFYTNGTASSGTGGGSLGRRVSFNVSRVVPTAADNRPRNRALLYCIKY